MIPAVLKLYTPISLVALKKRANLMRRTDNKYVLNRLQLSQFMQAQQVNYEALLIKGVNQFNYSSAYLDSVCFDTFLDHNKNRRRRFKLRFRHYHESNLYFFEIKIKGFRNETHKYRIATDQSSYHAHYLPKELVDFANSKIQLHYGFILDYAPIKSLQVDYSRITLVAKTGAERITIDNNIKFIKDGQLQAGLDPEYFILEVKSTQGRSQADQWLRHHQHRALQQCSKYSMGINIVQFPHKNTRFRPVLRHLFGFDL